MFRNALKTILIFLFMLMLYACENQQENTLGTFVTPEVTIAQSEPIPHALFNEPVTPSDFELSTGALSVWRTYSTARPTLLIFSSHPMLNPIDLSLRAEIAHLVATAPDSELLRRGRATASDTLLVSPQAVSAAIDANLIAELIVVLPATEAPDSVSLDKLRKRLFNAGFITESEAEVLTLEGSTVHGTVRGIPFQVPHPDDLPSVDGPLLLHVDLGYFKESYANEVKTPIYDLMYQFATDIRDKKLKPMATTLSYSNLEVGYSLSSRFVLRDLGQIMRYPEFLTGRTPASWRLRAESLKANIMYNESEAQELLRKAAEQTPGDAAALFDMALLHFQQGRTEEGFALLDQVVAIDPGFALAYIELADQGQRMGRWDKSLVLLQKAADAMPDHDELRIRLAGDLIRRGHTAEARAILAELTTRDWSEHYHPGVPKLLLDMQEAARVDSLLPLPDEPASSTASSQPPMRIPDAPIQRYPD